MEGGTTPSKLHQDAIIVDGLIIANFTREVFEDMRRGGLTAARSAGPTATASPSIRPSPIHWKRRA